MAEARSAIGVFEEHKRGIKLFISDDGIEISFHIPHPREIRQNALRSVFRLKRSLLRGVYPAPPYIAMAVICAVMGVVLASNQDSWWRNGNIAWIVWRIGNWCIPFREKIPNEIYVAYLAAWTAAVGFLIIMSIQRLLLRCLLSYRGWLYMNPTDSNYLVFVWGALLKVLGGRNALTFSYQGALPRLPLPSLEETCNRYLQSIHPILSEKEYEKTKEMTKQFQEKDGPNFQRYLKLKNWWSTNYVTDWWEKYVYLRGRSSIMINSNYYVLDSQEYKCTNNQISRASSMVYQMMCFKQLLDREQLPPLMIRGIVPLCMAQYKRIFSTTRIPHLEEDYLQHTPISKSKHIVVLVKGYYFKLPLYSKGRHGKLLSTFEIQRQLEVIMNEVENLDPVNEYEYSLASLTAQGRIAWAETYERHFSEGVNRHSIEVIESAVFMLVLDSKKYNTWTERGHALLHGEGSNRWFDKSFNLVVFEDGVCGLNAEHAWADAPVIAHVWEYCLGKEFLADYFDVSTGKIRCASEDDKKSLLPEVKILKWNTSCVTLQKEISNAMVVAKKSIDDLDLEVLKHNSYGKGFMKTRKVSPDAYIQMALQLAFYRNAGHFTQTYEASMTRLYCEGRTETVRPVTDASKAFVLAMENPNEDNQVRIDLFNEACNVHQQKYRDAMSGKGIDRHLFTLYCVSVGMGVESKFLQDALGRPWQLSTSQQPQQQTIMWKDIKLRAKEKQIDINKFYSPGGGFGPVVDHGYGVSYMITGEDAIFFHISSKRSCKETNSKKFSEDLKNAFHSIQNIWK